MSRFTPSPGYRLFLTRLVEARTSRDLTIEQLADRLGLPATLIAAYEAGEKPLDFVQTRTWCLALDVDFTDFVLQVGQDMEANLAQDEANEEQSPFSAQPLKSDDGDNLFVEFDELEGGD
jgi:transcriptional regulator with XRE-family HTH domain